MNYVTNNELLKAFKLDHLKVVSLDMRLRPDEFPQIVAIIEPVPDSEVFECMEFVAVWRGPQEPPAFDLDKMCADALSRVNGWIVEAFGHLECHLNNRINVAIWDSQERHMDYLHSHREAMAHAGFYGYPGGHLDRLTGIYTGKYSEPLSIVQEFERYGKHHPEAFR